MTNLTFYARSGRARKLKEGNAGFFSQTLSLIEKQGWNVKIQSMDTFVPYEAGMLEDYAIVDKLLSPHSNVVSFRETGFIGYWTLENAEYRHDFRMTKAKFRPRTFKAWQGRHFSRKLLAQNGLKGHPLPNAIPIRHEGSVLIALQALLLTKRTGQFCSPLEMIEKVRECEPNKRIVAKLHPFGGNTAEELDALYNLCTSLDVEVEVGDLNLALNDAHYVVTMNSTVVQKAMMRGIPSLVFADVDFHHICVSMLRASNAEAAFEKIQSHKPDYERYMTWYLEMHMINRRDQHAHYKALNMMVDLGFPLKKLTFPTL